MLPLQWDFAQQLKHNRDGSHSTQANRARTLDLAARELRELGYNNLRAANLKQRHIKTLVEHWQKNGRTAGTIKNRMSHLRWSLEKLGKPGVAGVTNDQLGIEHRQYVAIESKAIAVDADRLEGVRDEHLRMSLRLQAAFGLRREEALKIQPGWADQGDRLELKPSWTKGGRPRSIPIRLDEQRQLLREAKALVGAGSLIPPARSYVQQLRLYERQTSEAGISRAHGLRHLYAQTRYLELTGRQAPAVRMSMMLRVDGEALPAIPEIPANGMHEGLSDRQARELITEELGHSRTEITNIYLGSPRGA